MVHAGLRRDRTPWRFVFVGNEDTGREIQFLLDNTNISDAIGADWANVRVSGCIIDAPRKEWLSEWVRLFCYYHRELQSGQGIGYNRAAFCQSVTLG